MIRCKLYDADSGISDGDEQLIETWRAQPKSILWVDIEIQDNDQIRELLVSLGCHPFAISDALRKRHPPKIEAFEEHLFILYRGILEIEEEMEFVHQQVAFFISSNLLISVHPGRSLGVNAIWNIPNKHPIQRGAFATALRVMHYSAGLYLEAILQFETNLSDLEDALLAGGNDDMLASISLYRSRLLKLRRVFNYHKNITTTLLDDHEEVAGISVSDDVNVHLITDLHDRFERLHSLTQMHYEICGDLIEGYLSIASHQMNVTMRVLTVITAIFVPLSFLAGLYGMNFEYMPELKFQYGYFYLLGVMTVCATVLIVIFKRKRWF